MNDNRFRLKQLEKEISDLEITASHHRVLMSSSQSTLDRLRNERTKLFELLNKETPDIGISDHAILRYLERKYNFDIQKVRDEMLTPSVRDAIKCGANSIKIDGIKFVIKGGTVTTSI